MKNYLPMPFPNIAIDDFNPAIRLYGKRFINEQSLVEYLIEFLAILFSSKKIGSDIEFVSSLPGRDLLLEWGRENNEIVPDLEYKLSIKLNLKLFSFLSSSKIDTRHQVHKDHYEEIINRLKNLTQVSNDDIDTAIDWIEDLMRGFQGAGFNRAWCAQNFYPVSDSLLTQETLWNESYEKRHPANSWSYTIRKFLDYYSVSKHRFMARGGELLYLQICNALVAEQSEVSKFAKEKKLQLKQDELSLEGLHNSLQNNFEKLRGENTGALNQLIYFIENLDSDTSITTNQKKQYLSCEWCPRESWPEGFLFAVELNRLLSAMLEPVERLELLITGCGIQVLRSLSAQSARYDKIANSRLEGGALGYSWIFTPQNNSSRQQKMVSQRNLQVIQGMIYNALLNEELKKNTNKSKRIKPEKLYKEAHSKYGHKLFISLGKKMEIIVPKTGSGVRLVMTDKVLRYLVLTLLEPEERCTYDVFLKRMYSHYGIAVEGEELLDAVKWSGLPVNNSVQPNRGSWLVNMLRASGFLEELSDACSIVCNTFEKY